MVREMKKHRLRIEWGEDSSADNSSEGLNNNDLVEDNNGTQRSSRSESVRQEYCIPPTVVVDRYSQGPFDELESDDEMKRSHSRISRNSIRGDVSPTSNRNDRSRGAEPPIDEDNHHNLPPRSGRKISWSMISRECGDGRWVYAVWSTRQSHARRNADRGAVQF